MDLKQLCACIELQPEVREQVLKIAGQGMPEVTDLTVKGRGQETYEALKARCKPEYHGLDMLAWMLTAGLTTYENYQKMGIGMGIFADTMKCFTRFVGEHFASFGFYGFDRGFWAHRQLSMVLFRVGELEYELLPGMVSLHIPTDAGLNLNICRGSLEQFRDFARRFFPEWAKAPVYVESWLLSPALKELLREGSNILKFQEAFTLKSWEKNDTGFLQWVYGREDIPFAELPENTSLQRNMKQYLLAGGKVGSAEGFLKEF